MTTPMPITGGRWFLLMVGLAAVFTLFDGMASALGSDRGQAGLLVGAVVVVTTLLCNRWLLGAPAADSVAWFGRPSGRSLLAALMTSAALALVVPAYAIVTGYGVSMDPKWPALLPGLFAQAGVAEETLFRAYLFGHLRRGRTFWRTVVLAAAPFVLVHLILFARMPWPIALASVLLAAIVTVPLARAYELGGNTIWAAAILHCAIQGIVKVVIVQGPAMTFALVWIAASAVIPFAIFAVRSDRVEDSPG